jgi:type II secretory ATPase GspE/PulE/Tfp pilus assembly ATPase PilB-like protein
LGAYPQHTQKRLTTILIEAGVVTRAQVDEMLAKQSDTGQRTGEILVEMGLVSEEDIGWALSRQLELTFVDPHLDALDIPLIREYPEELLRRIQAVPLVSLENELGVALADPTDQEALEELSRRSSRPLGIGVATPTTIRAILDRVFGYQQDNKSASRELRLVTPDPGLAWESSGAEFLSYHVAEALKWKATEIHFVPTKGRLDVFYRIGPDLNCVAGEKLPVLEFLQTRLESLGVSVMESGAAYVGGRITHPLEKGEIELDVSMVRGEQGVAITLQPRRAGGPPPLEDIGLSKEQGAQVRAMLEQPAGCLLVSGPGRCGASTTLASMIAAGSAVDRRVIVFQPPHAEPIPRALCLQMEAAKARESWQEIVEGQCADVVVLDGILMGEHIRDILHSAASGRLVLVRTDWLETGELLEFLLRSSPSRSVLSRRLLGVIQERLVRYSDSDKAPDRDVLPLWQRGVFEVMSIDEATRQALCEGESMAKIFARAAKNGYTPLAEECRRLVENDLLSAAEAARVLT